MKNLKRAIIAISFASFFLFTGELKADIPETGHISVDVEEVSTLETPDIMEVVEFRDCTINIKSDGIDIEVTFHDVSWLQCTVIKVGKWFQDTF